VFQPLIWKIRDKVLSIEKPLVMGILNVTPDSFYDGGFFLDPKDALNHALRMAEEGADLLDVGGESTRPGAKPVSTEEETGRLFPALELILREVHLPVSLDTTKSDIAEEGLRMGVSIVNDVSGLKHDERMAHVVAKHGAGIILMHRRGNPETMQSFADYGDVVGEIIRELSESVEKAKAAGILTEQIAVDPGLGFSKTAEQNFQVIRSLREFRVFSRPVVVGPSRKSFLGAATGKEAPERIYSTSAVSALLVERGAHVLRVHDVSAVRDAVSVAVEVSKS